MVQEKNPSEVMLVGLYDIADPGSKGISIEHQGIKSELFVVKTVSYTHLTLPTTPYV